MKSYVHLVFRSAGEQKPELLILNGLPAKQMLMQDLKIHGKACNKPSNVYSSAADYAGEKEILENVFVVM